MSVLSDTSSSRTPSPPNLPSPRSRISVVNSRVGFKFQDIEELQTWSRHSFGGLFAYSVGSTPSPILMSLDDWSLPCLHQSRRLDSAHEPHHLCSAFQPAPPGQKWKCTTATLADAPAPTTPVGRGPTKLAHPLRPPSKHEFSSRRIVCIQDPGPVLDEEATQKSRRAEEKTTGSKHLSTFLEEPYGLTGQPSAEDDDVSQLDVHIEAILMPLAFNTVKAINTSPRQSRDPTWRSSTKATLTTTMMTLTEGYTRDGCGDRLRRGVFYGGLSSLASRPGFVALPGPIHLEAELQRKGTEKGLSDAGKPPANAKATNAQFHVDPSPSGAKAFKAFFKTSYMVNKGVRLVTRGGRRLQQPPLVLPAAGERLSEKLSLRIGEDQDKYRTSTVVSVGLRHHPRSRPITIVRAGRRSPRQNAQNRKPKPFAEEFGVFHWFVEIQTHGCYEEEVGVCNRSQSSWSTRREDLQRGSIRPYCGSDTPTKGS
ncbi:hypothetical protein FS837_001608 [Tulasnella sp. UAMH 9824]|nr:hypothetical protein FS837_001608 [Tulasnella sp. UAMH 9824]